MHIDLKILLGPCTPSLSGILLMLVLCMTPLTVRAATDQEGFSFGDDDNNESTHTLDTQDTNITEPVGTKTLRVLIDGSGDPPSSAYKLKYQKNGTGGYIDVPLGSSGTQDLVVESGDISNTAVSDDNTTQTTHTVDIPAYADGDLLVIVDVFWQDNNQSVDVISWGNGPNSESVTTLEAGYGPTGNQDSPQIAIGYFIANGSSAASTVTLTYTTATNSTRHVASVIHVPDGEFDPSTPLSSAVGTANSPTDNNNPNFTSFSANSDDGGGKLVVAIGSDQDPVSAGPASGWTTWVSGGSPADRGRAAMALSGRDTAVTGSESISAPGDGWTIANDAWSAYAFIIRSLPVSNEVFVSTSGNVAAGGESTTFRLTPPGGKTTGDFDTGRRWDDENGSDSIDITTDNYTELEWILTTQSPAAVSDYYDFRVYNVDVVLDTYSLTPRWTIGSNDVLAGPVGSPRFLRLGTLLLLFGTLIIY